ncbi:MAG: hypothetical protein J0H34_13625 [Rhizobiales bacterium]|nr:hypothetical protein [Hyphomicrobiales bacterium]
MTVSRFLLSAALVAALGLVSACGRRSDLDTPYQAAVDARKEAEKNKEEPLPPVPEKPDNDKPFFLDKLIK